MERNNCYEIHHCTVCFYTYNLLYQWTNVHNQHSIQCDISPLFIKDKTQEEPASVSFLKAWIPYLKWRKLCIRKMSPALKKEIKPLAANCNCTAKLSCRSKIYIFIMCTTNARWMISATAQHNWSQLFVLNYCVFSSWQCKHAVGTSIILPLRQKTGGKTKKKRNPLHFLLLERKISRSCFILHSFSVT